MSDDRLRVMLTTAVEGLRAATDLTMDEIIGIESLPDSMRTPEVCYWLGVVAGASTALRATGREMLDELDLLTAPRRPDSGHQPAPRK
jgi:uncharacterized protein YjgD (DUF1641 family)